MKRQRSQVECLGGHATVVITSREDERAIVSVCLQKDPGEPPILAEDLDARAFDERGQPLPLLERPRPGPVIEVSTMGPTASARFVFARQADQDVSRVDVRLGEQEARFWIVQARG